MPGPVHRAAPSPQIPLPPRRPARAAIDPASIALHTFEVPSKKLKTETQINDWLLSEAFFRIMDFVQALNDSVVGMRIPLDPTAIVEVWDDEACRDPNPEHRKVYLSPKVQATLVLLNRVNELVESVPPREREMGRMGNVAFTDWIGLLEQSVDQFLGVLLPQELHGAVPELVPYLAQAFGNGQRRDYGSGHELTFVALLCCLDVLGFFDERDYPALVLQVFDRYLQICRTLQIKYNLEPAGSHGVWGLDDHQFLAFTFGAAQLRENPTVTIMSKPIHENTPAIPREHVLKPKSILNDDLVAAAANDYLYFGCIAHIKAVKRGPFSEHSPMLYDISAVPTWVKVNSGLLKMFVNEVLAKFPVVQHFLFGTLLPLERASTALARDSAPLAYNQQPASPGSSGPVRTT
ncbi:Phosphotyrosyl phosphatase activator [Gonapodya prolifera JEL478]|uniref:Serine/threonine-protein phosphatase 2A activator n=1 Tax=Gonapodya prolifera (strain JEL478) TaxID=1344416 RepID=A0A139AWI1_GONPJ|nr:Phosphotyrosyl phosphatase activator [Gonapodya prolifera JEL478]|eukprot:KXS20825.1 Phosphotyrosyl phosphatase activator [Gonapodya prolifera JEL478]